LAGQAIPHPPQLAGSLLTSAGQVPDACVTAVAAVTGWEAATGAAADGTGVAAGVSWTVTRADGAVFLNVAQPAVSMMRMMTAHRKRR
jgi:hypothetical protein